MSYDTAKPFIASYVIFRENGKIAFLLRKNTSWMSGYYGLPSGKVEKNESYTSAAIREMKEEVGVDLEKDDLEFLHVCHRHEPSNQADDWVDIYFEAKSWKGELHNAEPDVHGELVWYDINNLPKNVVSSVKWTIEQIELGRTFSQYGWSD